MSINIHFTGTRDILVIKTGKQEVQDISFGLVLQTPSNITRKIMQSEDPFAAYRDWVLSEFTDETQEIYDDDDDWCEKPIGYKTVNYGVEHVEEFNAWLQQANEAGYKVVAECW
jgi:hypothetical protein